MKAIVRKVSFYGFSLFLLTQIFSGVKIYGGLITYIIAGFALSLLFLIIKPILTILTLTLNLATLGLFSFIINAIILYLLTVMVPGISISSFVFKGFSFAGFIVPDISFNAFFAFIASSMALTFVIGF